MTHDGRSDSRAEPTAEPAPTAAPRRDRSRLLYAGTFAVALILFAGVAALLVNITTRKTEGETTAVRVVDIEDGETDAAIWGPTSRASTAASS